MCALIPFYCFFGIALFAGKTASQFTTLVPVWDDLAAFNTAKIVFDGATKSSINVTWKYEGDFLDGLYLMIVHQRARSTLFDRGTFKFDRKSKERTVHYGENLQQHEWKSHVLKLYYNTEKTDEMTVHVANLKFPSTEHEIVIQRIAKNSVDVAKIVASTGPARLETGPGFFEVVRMYARTMVARLYWLASNGKCNIEIYEWLKDVGEKQLAYSKQNVLLRYGFVETPPLKLSSRYHVYFVPLDAAGREKRILIKRLIIPDYESMLESPSNFVGRVNITSLGDMNMYTYTFDWEQPKYKANITTYGIISYTTIRRRSIQHNFIYDRQYEVKSDLTTFNVSYKASSSPDMNFGLIVNAGPFSSSGILFPILLDEKPPVVKMEPLEIPVRHELINLLPPGDTRAANVKLSG